MRSKLNTTNLVPEEYSGYKIYTAKVLQKLGYQKWEQYLVKIVDKQTGIVVHEGQANINFGVYEHRGAVTKEDVIEAAKKFIDNNLAGRNIDRVKVGDLFYTSWGYDQTNYDYLIVTQVSPTGKTVKARMTGYEPVGYSGQSYKQKPVPKPYGKEFQLKVDYYQGKLYLKGQYYFGNPQDSKRMGSFTKVKSGEIFYETDTRFGH